MMNSRPAVAVSISGLRVLRGDRVVLPDVHLQIPRGLVVGLLGPSGGGKTTLMRSIVGVQRVAGGEVRVLGLPAGTPEVRGMVGYVTQSPSVYPDLTVTENLRYFAAMHGLGRAAAAAAVARVIDTVDLGDHRNARVANLSGGQHSRVSLGAALLGDPQLLVLDEPTVGLDPVLRRDLWNLFHRLADDGATLLVSSHVMDEAVRCDRLLLMREGHILADLTLAELLERTGADDAETGFLRLVERQPAGAP